MFIDDPEVTAAEAVIDNGSFGKRVVRFETGRLAKQAAGSAMAYLDGETAVLSATTVGKHPKDQFDFFPLTVDVEERQYAAGRIPGSFFRREGRAGTAAILACRLIDRPLRPSFVKGLRNEVQVVETVLAIHPDDDYDVLAINAASMSTQIAGLPFSGPVAGTRLALIDGHWVAFPRYSEQQRATFQMVVAGRVLESGDVAIMMVEAGATEHAWELINAGAVAPTEAVVAEGLEAAKPHIKALCEAQLEVAQHASKPTAEFPLYLDYSDEQYDAVEKAAEAHGLAAAIATEGKQARDLATDAVRDEVLAELAESFPTEEDTKALKAAFRSVTKKIVRHRTLTDILGSEDAFGDMDFKVAGTRDFITALQLDTKLDGLPSEVLAGALGQARDARLFILDVLAQAIDAPDEMAPTAPRVLAVRIPVDKIGEVIGPKGKMINQIQEDTGADLTVEDDGTVYIGASDGPSAEAARDAVNAIANPQMPEIGERFVGTVVKTTTFGAFVSLTPGKDGLLHISQIRRLVGGKRVENVEDVLGVGDKVQVELAEIDQRGKLSLHAVLTDEQLAAEAEGEASRKASREGGSRREAKDEDGEQPRRERRPRRRRMRSAESSEEE